MQLSPTLSWLVDAAGETPGADRLLAELGARLSEDGLPLAGGALSLAVPHPLIARRTWLWRAASGEVIEALGSSPTAVDELVRRCQVSAATLSEVLIALELEGRLERHRGNRVSLI